MSKGLIVEERTNIAVPPVKTIRWRNIVFSKMGKTYRGEALYDSQAHAEERMLNVVAKVRGNIPNSSPHYKGWNFPTLDGPFTDNEYSWHMQLPEVL